MTVRLYEWDKTETGWAGIEITENKVVNLILRNLNNLIKINSNNEVYVDLQLDDNLQSSATMPIWVNVGRVLQANWRPVTGTLISAKTTSGDVVKILYGDDWQIYVDNGTGTWKILQYKLTAGENIQISSDNVISATDTTYTAWENIQISDDNVISATGGTYNAWDGINIWDVSISDMQWPCDEGWHIPLRSEWEEVINIWIYMLAWTNRWWTDVSTKLHLPMAWSRSWMDGTPDHGGSVWNYWCSDDQSAWGGDDDGSALIFGSNRIAGRDEEEWESSKCRWFTIRPFKNEPVVPILQSTIASGSPNLKDWWTQVWRSRPYQEVTADFEAWIYWNSTLWLISVARNSMTEENYLDEDQWITFSDKNLWATTVWSNGDALTQANCGNYYQRWNCYWFPFTWAITTSSTKPDASGYWPWNYYSSDTFILVSPSVQDWSSVNNSNLWGGVSQWLVTQGNVITNIWVLSVNWETWAVTVNTWAVISAAAPATPQTWQFWYDTTNSVLKLYDGNNWISI